MDFKIPPDKRLALVDKNTWLFPKKTVDALREVIAHDAVSPDYIYHEVQKALGEHDLEFRVAFGEIQYRTDPSEPWHTLLQLDSIASSISGDFERHDFPTAVGQWSFPHSLGRVPTVTTYSVDGERILGDERVTGGFVTVTWAYPTAGFAVLT